MKSDKTIDLVVQDGLCTNCGTCVGICPEDAIDMVINSSKGIYIPKLDRGRCNECGICFEVCPGHTVDFRSLNSEIFGKQPDDRLLGNYLSCYSGYATDYGIRYNAASGGLVTTLLIFALEQGIIDGALVTRMREDKPLEPQPFIARTREEIIIASKSKYCPVPANIALREILNQEGKFAVVGLPCHIHGVRKAEVLNKKLKDRIVLHIGIFCSHPMTFCGTEFLLKKYGIDKPTVDHLHYRGEGWPGSMSINYKDGTRKLIPHYDHMIFHDLGFFTPMRCTLCCDDLVDFADISCGDAWVRELMGDKIGTSVIISRNTTGEKVLEQAISKNNIILENIETGKVRVMGHKKADYKIKSQIARLCGKKLPKYKTELPRPGLIAYPLALQFMLNIALSKRCFWWFIGPLACIERTGMRLIGKFTKLIGLR